MISFKNKKFSLVTPRPNWHGVEKKKLLQTIEIPVFNKKTQVGITRENVQRPLPIQMIVAGLEAWGTGFERENHSGEEVLHLYGGNRRW